uniref:hypothetical protein n=1 Tax=Lysinibacillus sp. D4B2_S17 TaxID=2941225 RepID=UPI0020BEE204
IKGLWRDGVEVLILNKGEKGTIKVKSILDDLGGYLSDNPSISVLGNDTLEEGVEGISSRETSDKTEMSTEIGILGKMKSWFS